MNYTLVIIDMQYRFDAALCSRTIEACKREMIEAYKRNNPIILVKYYSFWEPNDDIISDLLELPYTDVINKCLNDNIISDLLELPYTDVINKCLDDGSKEVDELISEKSYPTSLRVCGVNARYCVNDTILGLKGKYKITAVADAINCCSCCDEEQLYNTIQNYSVAIDCVDRLLGNMV